MIPQNRHIEEIQGRGFETIAFFPEYQLKDVRSPSLKQMLETYDRVKDLGLENVRLGNIGIFVRTEEDLELLRKGGVMK